MPFMALRSAAASSFALKFGNGKTVPRVGTYGLGDECEGLNTFARYRRAHAMQRVKQIF